MTSKIPFKSFPIITSEQYNTLQSSSIYLKINELKNICRLLHIPHTGVKTLLIDRILEYLTTGNIKQSPVIPPASRAQKGKQYPLTKETLMLKGSYKNDLKNREFFKQIIGNHFHFTAFGIDWLNERWISGNPPTYQEFATMWQQEYSKRKSNPEQPKQEWAYINFVQNYIKNKPNSSKSMIQEAWKQEQKKHVQIVHNIVKSIIL